MRELSISVAAGEAPDRECVVEGGNTHTFADVAERVASAVERLRELGVQSGTRVALTPRADLDSVVWLFALFELGAPALLLHPRLTVRERTSLAARVSVRRTLDERPPTGLAKTADSEDISSEQTLAIVYTSGTSGAPRGAVLSRRAFVASARAHAANLGWRDDDRWLLTMPPAHVGGLSILTRSLIARRCVVLAPGPFDASDLVATMGRDRVTLLSVVPTMLHRLLDTDPKWQPHPELRAVLVGGAAFHDSLRERAADRGIPVLGTYGCTEACSQVATQSLAQVGTRGSGSPLEGIELRIEDGEIQVRGDVVMDGYVGEPHSSDAFSDDGWLRTGDLGEIGSDGQLHVRGRRDDTIITGGENVDPVEVEAWLESQPGIVSACVFGVPDDEYGEAVAAALVVHSDVYDESTIQSRMKRELAGHKQPRGVALLDELPLNASGKVDRRAVAERSRGDLRPI
jgi:O-succinylbenzoic acid--CoA ligase